MKAILLLLLTLFLSVPIVHSQNPIIKDIGMSDPHVRVFNDTIYLYTGHDSHPDDKIWVMRNWRVFSTTNLKNWKQLGTISPKDNYMENNTTDCWAADAATRNGKYYFYFSDRKRGVGVMSSDSPEGPFKDALGKPLVSPMHDPTILIDDDESKTPYLIYGDKEGGGFHIAQLNEDMISTAETSKPVKIIGKEWDKAPAWMDKNYIFKHKDTYYLTWGRDYAISKNIYGPYECVGAVGNGHNLNEFAHGSFFWWKDQFYHMWCYYIRPGYKYREVIITYCHFDDEGLIVSDTDFLDKHKETGVAQYDASWDKIQAEWYYEKSPESVKKGTKEKGFRISNLKNESWLKFDDVAFSKKAKRCTANIKATNGSGKIEIRQDSLSGKLLGVIEIPENRIQQNRNDFVSLSGKLKKIQGTKAIYLKFTSTNECIFELDWFSFSR